MTIAASNAEKELTRRSEASANSWHLFRGYVYLAGSWNVGFQPSEAHVSWLHFCYSRSMENSGASAEITALLDAWSAGDRVALDRLMPLVFDELHALARAYMARDDTPHSCLQPTALVNEAYLRLAGRRRVHVEDRLQLFSVLAQTLREILVDHARKKRAAKHGSGMPPLSLDEALGIPVRADVDLVALDDALRDLAGFAPRQAKVVHLSYFGGLRQDEIARVLGISAPTVRRDLKAARLWLLNELRAGD